MLLLKPGMHNYRLTPSAKSDLIEIWNYTHRKNALFYKTRRGAKAGDLFMSLIHTCQLEGVNPLDYLTWLLENTDELQNLSEKYLPCNYGHPSG